MLTADGKRLLVLEEMQIDWELPKYKNPVQQKNLSDTVSDKSDENATNENVIFNGASFHMRALQNVNWTTRSSPTLIVGSTAFDPQNNIVPVKKPSLLSKLAFWKKSIPDVQVEPVEQLSIEDFFKSVKNTQQEIVIVQERAAGYERAMVNAKNAGQQALLEQLVAGLNAYRMETQLVAMGLNRFVSEEDVVNFYKQSKRGLRLDYVRNFTRAIPENIVNQKTRADKLGIFDNYVVLHYDPNTKSYAETEEEKARRRDPILFGLMKGRRVLYVIGDWVDEVCDLTLDQLAEVLGKDVVQPLPEVK